MRATAIIALVLLAVIFGYALAVAVGWLGKTNP
jgi:hypothetical protein